MMYCEKKNGLGKHTKRNKFAFCLSIAVLAFFVSVLPASAVMVAQTDGFTGNLGDSAYAPDGEEGMYGDLGFTFTTDANGYKFNSVTLYLGTGTSGETGPEFFVSLLSAEGDTLEILDGDTNPTQSDTQYEYTGSYTLEANTTYWILLSCTDETGAAYYDFWGAGSTDESEGSVWTIGDDIYSTVMGEYVGAGGPLVAQFDATPVPLPSSTFLLFSGFMGLVALRRKLR